jgi:hypothetical protein
MLTVTNYRRVTDDDILKPVEVSEDGLHWETDCDGEPRILREIRPDGSVTTCVEGYGCFRYEHARIKA